MKFKCEKMPLITAIVTASHAVSTKTPVPSLEGLLIEAGDGVVSITGYDLKTGIVTKLDADVQEKGSVVLNARLFGDIVKKLPGSDVFVSVSANYVATIKSDKSDFEIPATPAADYPELPPVDTQESISIDASILRQMISQTNFAVSDNESRPIFTGSLFESNDGKLTIVAVDGFRLALRREMLDRDDAPECNFIVPGTALGELEKIVADDENAVTITLGTKQIVFTIGDTILLSRRLEGEFLNYRNSIPQNGKCKLKITKCELIAAVERVLPIIDVRLKTPLRCTFNDGVVKLYAVSSFGKANDECALEGNGEGMEIGFDPKYLLDALKAAPADEIYFELTNSLNPCIISSTDGSDNFLYLVLPVRLKSYES